MENSKLDFLLKNNMNVLISGKHGVGKTAQIVDCFRRNNTKFLYFSGSTMDAWVDLVGLPKETSEDGIAFTRLVPPEAMAKGQVEAIFIDEFNRAPKKVRNALMELIQFKSINGRRYPNLRVVWAAVNPDDVNLDGFKYDVDPIDPAQLDRFQVKIVAPYQIDAAYFESKYGTHIGAVATGWWNDLDEKNKNLVSPRRMDEAMRYYLLGGDITDVLYEPTLPVSKLATELEEGATERTLNRIYAAKDEPAGQKFFSNINNVTNSEPYLVPDMDKTLFFSKFIPPENIQGFATKLCERWEKLDTAPTFEWMATFCERIIDKMAPSLQENQRKFIQAQREYEAKQAAGATKSPEDFHIEVDTSSLVGVQSENGASL